MVDRFMHRRRYHGQLLLPGIVSVLNARFGCDILKFFEEILETAEFDEIFSWIQSMGSKCGKTIRNKITTSNPLLQEFLAELVGTFCLVVSCRKKVC